MKRDLGHRGTAARVLTGMAAVGTVPAFAPSIVLSIPRAPSWRWRRTRALRHSTQWRMCLLLSPRTRLESTLVQPAAVPNPNWLRPCNSKRGPAAVRRRPARCAFVGGHPQCGIDQQLELDLCCGGRGQSVCAAEPGTVRARCSPPSHLGLRFLDHRLLRRPC